MISARATALFTPFLLVPLAAAQDADVQNANVRPASEDAMVARVVELRAELRELQEILTRERAECLGSVTVNGVELSPEHVRREAIFLAGARLVKAKISDFFIQEWMEQQIAAGRDPSEFEFSEEAIIEELQGTVQAFQRKNPGVEFWEAIRAMTGLTREGYMQQRRQTELFRKVFFPGPPGSWPSISKEAIIASAGGNGQQFWESIEKSSTDPETGEPREMPAFWMRLCQGWVLKKLESWSDIRYPSDGLPPDVVLSVNGRTWKTDEAFEFILPGLFLQDALRAMTEVVIREALTQALREAGAYLSDEQFRAEFEEYRKEFDSTVFTTEVIAVNFKGYPSLEAFRQRWRLIRSFEHMIAEDINDDELQAHADRFARFFSNGRTSVDVIQLLARDVKTGAWELDGFAKARQRAEDVMAAIREGADFDEMLDSRGEYYKTDKEKGRLASKSLNALRQSLMENEFSDLLQGYSIARYLFYDAEPGQVVGPLRGPNGYYVARVNARTPARSSVSVKDPKTRELVKQDYVSYRFLQWANGALANTTVE